MLGELLANVTFKRTRIALSQATWRQAVATSLVLTGIGLNPCRGVAQDNPVRLITRNHLATDANVVRNVPSRPVSLTPLEEKQAVPVVTALAADPTGDFLAVAGDDHAIRIVMTSTGQTIRTLKAHTDWIHSLVFSMGNEMQPGFPPTLYSAGDDRVVMQWEQGQPPREVVRFPFAIRSLSLSTEKNLLAIGGFSDRIILWDLTQSKFKHVLMCDCGDQRCVRFCPDGEHLLCGGRDGEIVVWNTESGEEIAKYQGHRGRIYTASFSTDGDVITSVGTDRRLLQYDLVNKQLLHRTIELPAKLMSMCLINDSVVAIAGADNSIQLYDFQAEVVIADLREHLGTVAVMCPFRGSLASGSFDTTVRIWDLDNLDSQRVRAGQPVSYSPIEVDEKLRIR
ncbi:WD40 repeat domain-containing protein [Aureliella helgolandensis]|uniref:WD domain, G-beta repeat n=1 Tax=Aureliella helgolandensis TaxID=2527968 RepID=A0A518G5N8_9BACT|nr:WD40 repeat domain-containing protein [Aureliella helgolandensis]QDV23902.1 WD domain, G-beta repeat [Aureliella helgolandensis]